VTHHGIAQGLDHVGIVGADLGAMAAAYEHLGFTLTPLARHAGRRTPDGPVVFFGTGNRCVMLQQGYLELLAVLDPTAASQTVPNFLKRYAGIHTMALEVADADATLSRLATAGFGSLAVSQLDRPANGDEPDGPHARFDLVAVPGFPEGRVNLIRHRTRDAVWQPRFLAHANNASALEEVVIAVESPAETAARFSRFAGCPVLPDPAGGYALPLPRGRIRLLTPAVLHTVLPGTTAPCLPFIAGVALRTSDNATAIARLAQAHAIPARPTPRGLLIDPAAASGAALHFLA
jgi:hypothetical protein